VAAIKETPRVLYLNDGIYMMWIVLAVALLMYGASRTGTNADAMPSRTTTQEVDGWMSNGGAGAGRETQVAAKNSKATWTECQDMVLSGTRQEGQRPPPERIYYHNGLETPEEAFNRHCKLNRMRVAAKLKRRSEYLRNRAEIAAGRRRLDPDESTKQVLPPHETKPSKPKYAMNEFSCYLCQLPIRTAKQLMNHVNGRPHKRALEFMKRGEKEHDYNRDNPGTRKQTNPEPRTVLRRSTRTTQHARERFGQHQNDYIGSGDNRVNSHIGPGPDCSSDDYEPDIPDDPCGDNPSPDMYMGFQPPSSTYYGFQLPAGPLSIHDPNTVTGTASIRNGDVPRVVHITPDPRTLTRIPTSEDLVRRFGDGWKEVPDEKWELKDG